MVKKVPNPAYGNTVRQANKKLRRQRILELATNLMASEGAEAFTINRLASEALLSTPTIHNLFGKKSDIFKELVSSLIEKMQDTFLSHPPIDPIENAKFFLDNMVTAFEQDSDFYRAAFMSAEHLKLFDPRIPGGFFQRAQQIAEPRKEWYESELFLGNIPPSTMMKAVHNSNRLGRLDWVGGFIDLNQFRHQVLESILLAYASDASPELHVRLSEEINGLNSL